MNQTPDYSGLLACRRCPRFQRQFRQLRQTLPDYWNRPVPPCGNAAAPLLVIGLAPGKHGANRTGIPFTGDASGDLLGRAFERFGISGQVQITNAVKCLPINNQPSTTEVKNCQRFLAEDLRQGRVWLALGGVAHRAVLRALDLRQSHYPFAHAAIHDLPQATLINSYHCSRYNTQTRRLTEEMFYDVVELAAQHAGLLAN